MKKYGNLAEGIAGEVVTARCFNRLENARSMGKVRPVVLVQRESGHWWVMGLTTNPNFRDGRPRTPLPNPAALGLSQPGFLWGRLTRIAALDVYSHIGWAPEQVMDLIERQLQVGPSDRAA